MPYHKKWVPNETKDINVKVFNIITNKNETKAMEERISCDCKCKFNSAVCNSNKKWNNKHVSVNVKIIVRVKKIIVGILACVFFENSKYLKSTSVT